MMKVRGNFAGLALAVLIAGCATTNVPGATGGRMDRLSRAQIMAPEVSTLYDVVQRLRPRWLRASGGEPANLLGGSYAGRVVVYQNQAYLGDVEVLRQMAPDAAQELRYLDGPTASATLPGLSGQMVSGAIVIYTSAGG